MASQYTRLLCAAAFVTVVTIVAVLIPADARFTTSARTLVVAASRTLYAVNQSSASRGSISVYDIDHGHSLLEMIPTVVNVDDVKGVAVSAAKGKLYVA
jgi:hypothetical protein